MKTRKEKVRINFSDISKLSMTTRNLYYQNITKRNFVLTRSCLNKAFMGGLRNRFYSLAGDKRGIDLINVKGTDKEVVKNRSP